MSNQHPQLAQGSVYHIYNRANGKDNLFLNNSDYQKFLTLLEKYIVPVADIFAWTLMRNHFHLCVQIKENIIYKHSKSDFKNNPQDWEKIKWQTRKKSSSQAEGQIPDTAKHFAHLFNAYAKYYNENYKRHGSLFQRPFKRKELQTDQYHSRTIVYIHCNAVHHGFVPNVADYPWSSYHQYLTEDPSFLSKIEIIDLFGGIHNFRQAHENSFAQRNKDGWLTDK